MIRYFRSTILLVTVLLLTGCVSVDEPLVDLGGYDGYQAPKERDPAPGVPTERLTREQRLQRDLAQCQQLLEIKEAKYDKLKERRKEDKKRYKEENEDLEDRIKDLEKGNRKLRKELRKLRAGY